MIFLWEVPFYFLRVPQRPGSPTRQPITVISGGRSIGNSGCTSWSAPLCACEFPTGARGACWCRAKLCVRSVSAHKHQAKQRRARKPAHWPALAVATVRFFMVEVRRHRAISGISSGIMCVWYRNCHIRPFGDMCMYMWSDRYNASCLTYWPTMWIWNNMKRFICEYVMNDIARTCSMTYVLASVLTHKKWHAAPWRKPSSWGGSGDGSPNSTGVLPSDTRGMTRVDKEWSRITNCPPF